MVKPVVEVSFDQVDGKVDGACPHAPRRLGTAALHCENYCVYCG